MKPLHWTGSSLKVLDQRLLPAKTAYLTLRRPEEVAEAIRSMALRGAPLIGCAAAYGLALAAKAGRREAPAAFRKRLERAAKVLKASRPTAVALAAMVDRLLMLAEVSPDATSIEAEARAVEREDAASGHAMAALGAKLLPRKAVVITYCNTGALATAGPGTALGVIVRGYRTGRVARVYACETRPYLQGSRLTAWELGQAGVPHLLITDNMAGHILATEKVDAVLVGADRIAANGDTANKIGTYALAVLARHHKVPFYVVAPAATIDRRARSGRDIPIEERSSDEVTSLAGRRMAPAGTRARHPAFDVTPRSLVTALVTERGVVRSPGTAVLHRLFQRRQS